MLLIRSSDIYSLGATLFFLLTGQLSPFTGDYLELVYGHRHGPKFQI